MSIVRTAPDAVAVPATDDTRTDPDETDPVRTGPGRTAHDLLPVPATDDPRPVPVRTSPDTTSETFPDPFPDPFPDLFPDPLPGRVSRTPRPGRVASDRAGSVGRDLVLLLVPWICAVATLATRLATAAVGPTDWDSAQFAAAVGHFDVAHGRPQPPGYFLYVVTARLVDDIGSGVIHSLVLVAALASAAAVGLTVVAGRDLGGRWVGLAAGLLVATSPFAWYSGSIVTTYSFDLLVAPLLIILAWRARPHSWHGAAAIAALGLLAGFRQSAVLAFALLALLAVLGSVRRTREAVLVVVAAITSVAVWFVPMALAQPGGVRAWARATDLESAGAAHAYSVIDRAAGATVNLGTFAAYTTIALAPLAVLALLSACVLAVRALGRRLTGRGTPPPVGPAAPVGSRNDATLPLPLGLEFEPRPQRLTRSELQSLIRSGSRPVPDPSTPPPLVGGATGDWSRPWYQSRPAILAAAVVPPAAVVALIEFAKGGYLLAYLPGAVIALLLLPGALLRRPGGRPAARRTALSRVWLVVASVGVLAIATLGAQRFLVGTGVLPVTPTRSVHGLWLVQGRYQAPYPDTRLAIRSADAVDADLARLGPLVDPSRDVVVIDSLDGGIAFYRNAGWELPRDRVALVTPGTAIYNEQFGSLYYTHAKTVPVGTGGTVYLIARPSLPGLSQLVAQGDAVPVARSHAIAQYRVWRIAPGAGILGVHVVVEPGHRPLGHGLA